MHTSNQYSPSSVSANKTKIPIDFVILRSAFPDLARPGGFGWLMAVIDTGSTHSSIERSTPLLILLISLIGFMNAAAGSILCICI